MKVYESLNSIMDLDPDRIMSEHGTDYYYANPGIVEDDCNNLTLLLVTSVLEYYDHLGFNKDKLKSEALYIQLINSSDALPSTQDSIPAEEVLKLEPPQTYVSWRDHVIDKHKESVMNLSDDENEFELQACYQICGLSSVSFVYKLKSEFYKTGEVVYDTVLIKESIFQDAWFLSASKSIKFKSPAPMYDDFTGGLWQQLYITDDFNTAYVIKGDPFILLEESPMKNHILVLM